MKHTLFIAMLTAAAGSQVFAEETINTIISDATYTGEEYEAYGYVGALGLENDATSGNVNIAEGGNEDHQYHSVYGGYSINAYSVNGNKVTMDSGKVGTINGGSASGTGNSFGNSIVIKDGTPQALNGGVANEGASHDNIVIFMGGSTGAISGGKSYSGAAYNNQIHLVGKSAALTLKDAQDNVVECSGSASGITMGRVVAGSAATESYNNTIDIYGYGLQAQSLGGMNSLTFHLTNAQMSAAEPCITLSTSTARYALNFSEATLQVKALDVQEWTPGTTITLVQSKLAIEGLNSGTLVNITDASGTQVLAQGKLLLTDGEEQTHLLQMTVQGVPEPATGTLSLLALAGLCIRRRRK